MSTKKLIIIIAFVALIIGIVYFNSKKNAAALEDGSANNGSSSGGTGSAGSAGSTGGNKTDKDDYWQRGNGDGKEQKDAGKTLDQSKVYLSDAQVKSVADKMHKMYDWTFSDSEFDEMLILVKNNIFTRADIFAVLNSDSYVYKRWYSWIVNDPNRQRLTRMNQVLKSNGVDYQFERGK